MDSSSESDDYEIEIKDYEEDFLDEMRSEQCIVRNSDSTLKCSFCTGKRKQEYKYKELLQHAMHLGSGSRDTEAIGFHRALEKYLKTDLADAVELPLNCRLQLEQDVPERSSLNESVVWPFVGIVVNIKRTEGADGKFVGAGSSELKERFSEFNPIHVTVLRNHSGHLGKAILEFRKDWMGYTDACMFGKAFAAKWRSRRDYNERKPGQELYGWMAQPVDYNSDTPIGKHLRMKCNLKTLTDICQEEKRKLDKLVANLCQTIQENDKQITKLDHQFHLTRDAYQKSKEEKQQLEGFLVQESKKCDVYASSLLNHQHQLVELMNSDSPKQKANLGERCTENCTREATTELEKWKLVKDTKNVDDKQEQMGKLSEHHKHENEGHVSVLQNERNKLTEKQELEPEIQSHMPLMQTEREDANDRKSEPSEINELLLPEEKRHAFEIAKEILTGTNNNDIQDILIKKMRDVQINPSEETFKKKYDNKEHGNDSSMHLSGNPAVRNKQQCVSNDQDNIEAKNFLVEKVCEHVDDVTKPSKDKDKDNSTCFSWKPAM